MLQTSIGRLRAIGIIEGISFLLLLGVAMPLKYFAAMPKAVSVVGWIHGLLFLAFCVILLQARLDARWNARRTIAILVAALLPFGPFVIDGGLRRDDEKLRNIALLEKASAA